MRQVVVSSEIPIEQERSKCRISALEEDSGTWICRQEDTRLGLGVRVGPEQRTGWDWGWQGGGLKSDRGETSPRTLEFEGARRDYKRGKN